MSAPSSRAKADPLKNLMNMLPPPPKPVGSYVPSLRVGSLVYTSGTLPIYNGQVWYTGALGTYGISVEHGQEAAKLCVLNALSIIQAEIGSFDALDRIVKLTGYVNSAPHFTEHPAVMNGASNLLAECFGEAGKHVRSAIGVNSLPLNASVELELVVAVRD